MDFAQLPMGSAMGIIENEKARNNFNHLTEAEKEQILFECKDARSKSDMDRIIHRLSSHWI